jgi:4-carboxymuconolactone decarboxylase
MPIIPFHGTVGSKLPDFQDVGGSIPLSPSQRSTTMNSPTPANPAVQSHAMGSVAPKLADLTERVLFGDVWQRTQLSQRERSLITVAALVALYRIEQLPFHLTRALENGLSQEELAEAITHLAFYAGWPCAASACTLLAQAAQA